MANKQRILNERIHDAKGMVRETQRRSCNARKIKEVYQ